MIRNLSGCSFLNFKLQNLQNWCKTKPRKNRDTVLAGEMEDDVDGREESKDTKPGKFAGISAEDRKWKTELPEEKYTRNAGGR